MKTLITGASGFLGQAVMNVWQERGPVVGLSYTQKETDLTTIDLRNSEQLAAFIDEQQPDLVIHCAAYRDPDWCEAHPMETQRLNVDPIRTMLDTLPSSARLLFISTDYVFDGEAPPYSEDHTRNPLNTYGQSKKEAEDITLSRDTSIVLRIPLLMGVGPTYETSGYIYKTAQALEQAEEAEIDDLTLRYPTDIRDVARATAFLIDKNANGIYHLSGPRGQTPYGWMLELAQLMNLSTHALMPTRCPLARFAKRPRNSALSSRKIKNLGFKHLTDFQDTARAVLALRNKT